MKKITYLLLFIFSSSIFAQSIQVPDIPSDGVNYLTTTQNATFDVSTEGPWDFSVLNPVDESSISMQPIENSQFSSTTYPNTTHVKSFMSGDQSVVQFPGFTESGYTYNGENSIIVNNYSSPLVIHPYPFNVGDMHSDGVFDIPFTCPICPEEMYRDHEVTSEALSSGTVIMPDGTEYENVVLVEHVATFTDGQTGSSPCITTRTSYFWWAPGLGIPLIETYSQDSTGACSFDSVQFSRFYVGQEALPSCPEEYELPIVWMDDFECYTPFAIDNIGDWISIDGNGEAAWQVGDVNFTNEGFIGSGIIWNNSQATADPAGTDISGYNTYEGDQGLYFFDDTSSNGIDDWMLSPTFSIQGVESPILSFWARSITDNWGLEEFRIAIGNSTNPDDFAVISGSSPVSAPVEWTLYEYDLSEYVGQNIKVGINFIGDSFDNDSFMLMMDSFKVEGTLGLNDVNTLEMSLYPNPVEGNFVTIQVPTNGFKSVEVYDIMGKILIDSTLESDILDVSSLNVGIYMIKVTVGNESKISKLIIK